MTAQESSAQNSDLNAADEYFMARTEMLSEPWMKHMAMSAEWIDHLNPDSVFEFGAGEGFWVHCFNALGVPTIGYEKFLPSVKPYGLAKGRLFDRIPNQKFDLVLFIDVGEHLTPEEINTAIPLLVGLSKKHILCSICDVSLWRQYYDPTHVTCRSKAWWVKKFTDAGCKELPVPENWLYREQLYLFEVVK